MSCYLHYNFVPPRLYLIWVTFNLIFIISKDHIVEYGYSTHYQFTKLHSKSYYRDLDSFQNKCSPYHVFRFLNCLICSYAISIENIALRKKSLVSMEGFTSTNI